MIYDITRTIQTGVAVWPGDTPFQVESQADMSAGAPINLTTITMSPHTGTHADAYYHYAPDGETPAQMPLDAYIGRAQVVSITLTEGEILPEHLPTLVDGVDHVLIHSVISDVPDNTFPQVFPYPSVALIDWLAERGVRLLGLDSPSFDRLDSKTLDGHNAIRQHGMVNLELLQLRNVPDGVYEHIALPLKLMGVCGSPVRAILRSLE
jgi:arylformamidase